MKWNKWTIKYDTCYQSTNSVFLNFLPKYSNFKTFWHWINNIAIPTSIIFENVQFPKHPAYKFFSNGWIICIKIYREFNKYEIITNLWNNKELHKVKALIVFHLHQKPFKVIIKMAGAIYSSPTNVLIWIVTYSMSDKHLDKNIFILCKCL